MKVTMKNFNIKEENDMYNTKKERMINNGAIAPKYEDTVPMSGIDFERAQSIASLGREIDATFNTAIAGIEEILNISLEIVNIANM